MTTSTSPASTDSPLEQRDSPLSVCSTLIDDETAIPPKLRLLIIATGPRDTSWAHALIVRLSKSQDVDMRAIVDDVVPRMTQTIIAMQNMSFAVGHPDRTEDVEFYRHQAVKLVEWAHLLVCLPLDADGIAKMLGGIADTFIGQVLRGWSADKSIVLVPGMNEPMWSNPLTETHLRTLRKKWKWIQVLEPILWHFEGRLNAKRVPSWNSFEEVLRIIHHRADLLRLGHDVGSNAPCLNFGRLAGSKCPKLPPEIWTLILEHTDDWELAQALGVFTTLTPPPAWVLGQREHKDKIREYEHELGWIALIGTPSSICRKLSEAPPNYTQLSALCIKVLIRFAHIEAFEYLESNRPDLFMALDGTTLPTKVSSFFPRIKVLNYWKNSKWFRGKHKYDTEAVDGASRHGHVNVLDWWWRQSGMPMRYTEASLEQASANGHVAVLQWWQDAALQDESVVLRPGRALLWAAQFGQADVLRWWHESKIIAAHGSGVVRMACQKGHPAVLEVWRRAKGDDHLYVDDGDVMCATSHCHAAALEWLRAFSRGTLPGMNGRGQPIAFRVCDIQACLHRNSEEQRFVRAWWAKNGIRPAYTAGERSRETKFL